jgi:hypothetical protein
MGSGIMEQCVSRKKNQRVPHRIDFFAITAYFMRMKAENKGLTNSIKKF